MGPVSLNRLERRLLDKRIAALLPLAADAPPPGGWLHAVRSALGMTRTQMARRLGVSDRAAAQMEEREVAGGITLGTLDKAARALGCRLVYAIVPESSLEDVVRTQARTAATLMVGAVETSMALEAQENVDDAVRYAVDDLADDLVRRSARTLWDAHDD